MYYSIGKIKSSQLYDFCNIQKQDVIHLLVLCEVVKPIWEYLEQIFIQLKLKAKINKQNIIWNKAVTPWNSAVNFIILVIKFYIFRCKVQNKTPTLQQALIKVDLWRKIEYYNACLTNRISKHCKKWSPVTQLTSLRNLVN